MKCYLVLAVVTFGINFLKVAGYDGQRPAFTAFLNTNVNVHNNYVFKFDKVAVNQGSHYKPSSGIFTAPTDGLYHFSCTILTGFHSGAFFYLMKNHSVYTHGYIVPNANDSQTMSVVMQLKRGDTVRVQSGNSYAVQKAYSYFSGYLL